MTPIVATPYAILDTLTGVLVFLAIAAAMLYTTRNR